MSDVSRLIKMSDLPEHVDEEMRKGIKKILVLMINEHPALAFAALQGAMAYYIKNVPKEHQRVIIDELAAGLKMTLKL